MSNFRNNEIVMESLHDMMLSQEGRNKIGYVDLACEAFENESSRSEMLNKLYKETQKIEGIDFGRIPDSKGDITKYQYYDQMVDMIDLINELSNGVETTNIIALNKLHQILLAARPDFIFGFKSNNFIITSMYKCMAMSLYEMINICIVDATEVLRQKASIKMNRKLDGKIRETTKNVNQFIKMYESGQWSTLMKAFKSGAAAAFAANESTIATENDINPAEDSPKYKTGFFNRAAGFASDTATLIGDVNKARKELPDHLHTVGNGISDKYNSLSGGKQLAIKSAGIVAIIVATIWIIRKAVYLYHQGAAKIKENITRNAEILKTSISNGSNTVDGVEKQKKLLDKLNKYSDVIDYQILKSERAASEEIKKADREVYNPQEIRKITGSDFEF